MRTLSVSIVTYNCMEHLARLLSSLPAAATGLNLEILVTDNNSSDGTCAYFDAHPDLSVIRNPENRFFTAADNQNLRRTSGEFVAMVNPDVVPAAGALSVLVQALDEHREAGAVAPLFTGPDATRQPSSGKFPTLLYCLFELGGINALFPGNPIEKHVMDSDTHPGHGATYDAEVLYGACLVLRREILERIGFKDESLIHGWDEYDVCRRIRNTGLSLLVVPAAKCKHARGASTATFHEPAILHRHHQNGLRVLYRKHAGPAAFLVLRVMLRIVAPFVRLAEQRRLKLRGKPD